MRLIMRCAAALAVLLASLNCAAAEEPIELATIPIPERDHAYCDRASRLLRSELDCDALVGEIAVITRASKGEHEDDQVISPRLKWGGDKTVRDLRSAFLDAKIDFDKEFVAVVFDHAGSGSVRFTVGEPVLKDGVLTLVIEKDFPQMATLDMAYRAFAIRLPRNIAQRVRLPFRPGVYRSYDLRTGEEILTDPAHAVDYSNSPASPQR